MTILSALLAQRSSVSLGALQLRSLILRISFIAAGALVLHAGEGVTVSPQVMWHPYLIGLGLLLYGLGFLLIGLALLRAEFARWQWLVLASAILVILAQYHMKVLSAVPGETGTDSTLFSGYATDILLTGHNPYLFDMSHAYSIYQVNNYYMTPQIDGSVSSAFPYPALHFLTLVPFKWFGFQDLRTPAVLAFIAVISLLFYAVPDEAKPLSILVLFINPNLLIYVLGWVNDMVWVLLIVIMMLAWQKQGWRAVAFGLACAYKQVPWLLLPFLLVRILLEEGIQEDKPIWQRPAYFLLGAGGVFALVNLPFFLSSPRPWISGVLTPVTAPLVYFGHGPVLLTINDVIPLTKSFYLWSSLTVLVLLLILYLARFDRLKHVMWLFPGIVLWFSYRSLQSYFIFWAPVFVLALTQMLEEDRHTALLTDPGETELQLGKIFSFLNRWKYTGLLVGTGGMIMILGGAALLVAQPSLEVEVMDIALNADLYQADRLVVHVANLTDKTLRPRFGVQRPGWQPYGWQILSGPPTLRAGEDARFLIGTDVEYRRFNAADGAQIVVTDASGDYRIRGTARVLPDRGLLDLTVYNSRTFQAGPGLNEVPRGWIANSTLTEGEVHLGFDNDQGFRFVELVLPPTPSPGPWESVSVAQVIPYSGTRFSVWIRPPGTTSSEDTASGIAFTSGEQRLCILFGAPGGLSEHPLCDEVIIQSAPAGVWSRHQIDVPLMFQKAGWLPPPYERYVNGNLEYLTRRVGMELFLTAQGEAGLQRARFGPIIPIHNRLTHQAAVRDSVNRSWEYLFALSATVRIQAYSDIEAAYWYQALDQSPPPVRESILSPIEAGMAQLPPGSTLLLDHEEFMTASYIQSQVGGGTDIMILDLETFLQDREATLKAEGMPSGAARAVANNELFALVEGRIESGEVFSLNPLALIRDDFVLKPVNGSLYRVMAGVHRDQ